MKWNRSFPKNKSFFNGLDSARNKKDEGFSISPQKQKEQRGKSNLGKREIDLEKEENSSDLSSFTESDDDDDDESGEDQKSETNSIAEEIQKGNSRGNDRIKVEITKKKVNLL